MRASTKRNQLYARHIVTQLYTKTRKVEALMAIKAIQAAVKATWQDSGQFAANWRISVGSYGKGTSPQFSRGTPPVGNVLDRRSKSGWRGEREVYNFVMQAHGINGNNPEMTKLFHDLVSGKGRMPKITIYNPLFDKGVSSGHQTPKPYWYYATAYHSTHQVEVAVKQAIDSAIAIARQRIREGAW